MGMPQMGMPQMGMPQMGMPQMGMQSEMSEQFSDHFMGIPNQTLNTQINNQAAPMDTLNSEQYSIQSQNSNSIDAIKNLAKISMF